MKNEWQGIVGNNSSAFGRSYSSFVLEKSETPGPGAYYTEVPKFKL
jgi:hypothetical protein